MTIPDYILQIQTLSSNEKLLYGLILTYQDNGLCEKGNEFFASKLNVGVRSIQMYLNHMTKLGFIATKNYGKVKNAIFIINHNDWQSSATTIEDTVSKILNNQACEKYFAENEKNFAYNENTCANAVNFRENDRYVSNSLVSNNKNINIKSACVRVRENVDNSTIFSSYEILSNTIQAPQHTQKERAPYLYLFENVYKQNSYFKRFIDEIVDTVIEADNQSRLSTGLRFRCLKFDNNNPFSDVLLNITDEELQGILSNIVNKYDSLKNRPAYILSAIINAGSTITPKKIWKLVGKGSPWCIWTPRNQYLSQIVVSAQNYYEHEKQNLKLKADYEKQSLKEN